MNTPQQIQDSSPIFYSQLPPPAIYIQPPQLCPNYGQPPPPQIHNRPPFSNGQATFKHDPVIIDGALGVVRLNDPNNPANSEKPVKMKCPSCEENITTVTKYVTSCDTYILAIVLVLVGCICLFWVPFVCKSCKNVIHSCPECNAVCGRFDRHYKGNRVYASRR